jgi:AcrR family transcriptional regulator
VKARSLENGSAADSHGRLAPARRRILSAVVLVAGVVGFAHTTVSSVTSRAGVSTHTFYGLFDGLDACAAAVIDWTLERVVSLASRALDGEGSWHDRLREALGAVLSFFDADPALARFILVEALAGGDSLLVQRQRAIETFRLAVTERIGSEVSPHSPLAAEAALAAVLGVLHARLIEPEPKPLVQYLGPLMGALLAPFGHEEESALQIGRGDALGRAIAAEHPGGRPPAAAAGVRQPSGLAESFGGARARRAGECLAFLLDNPGSSNREIATAIGVAHQSQISRLLSHLAAQNLVVRHSHGPGKRNAWRLTPQGDEAALLAAGKTFARSSGQAGDL